MKPLSFFQYELDTIAQGNLKIIQRIPSDKLLWKPHEKSMTLGRLGQHLAELPHWMNRITESDHFDFVLSGYQAPAPPVSLQEIIDLHGTKYKAAEAALKQAGGLDMDAPFEVRRNGQVLSKSPLHQAIERQLQHMVHHRGQLTVYLRLLDVPIPGFYGPSADEH
ncbi:MAG: DinB family protein [Flavobacteriales bacterium]